MDGDHGRLQRFGKIHRMPGFAYTQGGIVWSPAGYAVKHAEEMGWRDLMNLADWFVLIELVSDSPVDFCFGGAGSDAVSADRRDSERSDFSRCYGFVASSCLRPIADYLAFSRFSPRAISIPSPQARVTR